MSTGRFFCVVGNVLHVRACQPQRSTPIRKIAIIVANDNFATRHVASTRNGTRSITVYTPTYTLSLSRDGAAALPCTIYDLATEGPNCHAIHVRNVRVFTKRIALTQPRVVPSARRKGSVTGPPIVVPARTLFTKGNNDNPSPARRYANDQILSQIVIPGGVAIRLNEPTTSTQGIAISFQSCVTGITSDRICPA